MQLLTLILIALLPAVSLARSNHYLSRQHHGSRRHNVARANTYKLQTKHQGETFFNEWYFFDGNDPTHGNVIYEPKESASDLAYVQDDGIAVLRVDNKSSVAAGGKRRSVRITSKETYDSGLFIADFREFAHGPSVWPAFWTVGPQWPNNGEIDIIEYVNEAKVNQYTLHSGPGKECKLDPNATARYTNPDGSQPKSYLGNTLGLECQSSDGNNSGCGVNDFEGSAGDLFNKAGGGVVVMLWDETQISFWRFERDQIPQDIQDENPNPDNWGIPIAYWSDKSCDITNSFHDHSIIINISICGDWAGPAYANSGFPGTCGDAVANATNYDAAQIKVNYLSIYQKA